MDTSRDDDEIPQLAANIETIQNLEGLDTLAKIELIFILLGEKMATEFFVPVDEAEPRKAEAIQNMLIGMGLECDAPELQGDPEHGYHAELLRVAGNVDDLNKLLTTKDKRKFGELYGFPSTAIDAFVRAENGEPVRLLALEDLPSEIQNAEYAGFARFCFSENWQQELEVPKRWNAILKKYAPALHEKFVRECESSRERRRSELREIEESVEGNMHQSPTTYTLVNVESRWGQALPNSKIRWLDSGNEEVIDWGSYELGKKWKPEMTRITMLAQVVHNFTNFELSHIQADDGDELKGNVKLFGEYMKTSSNSR